MRVVVDSNVLFSALISPHAPPHALLEAWRDGRFELLVSQRQIDEIRRASRYPKLQRILQGHRVGALLNHLQRVCCIGDPPEKGIETDDPDDAFLLALASAYNADVLVTGDRRAGLLQRGHYGRARIVTPTVFCRDFLKITMGNRPRSPSSG